MGDWFKKMVSELYQDMNWQWWVAQGLATVSIIFAFTAMQQKNTTNILWHRSIYALLVFAGGVFLGKASVMVMLGVSVLRNIILLGLSYHDNNEKKNKSLFKKIKWTTFALLAASLIALNAVFWEGYLSILSMVDGLIFLTAFIQSNPANVRRITIFGAISSVAYFVLIFSPVNIVINLAVLVSSIVGLVKLDKKQKEKHYPVRAATIKK
jgi:hypothetical protein